MYHHHHCELEEHSEECSRRIYQDSGHSRLSAHARRSWRWRMTNATVSWRFGMYRAATGKRRERGRTTCRFCLRWRQTRVSRQPQGPQSTAQKRREGQVANRNDFVLVGDFLQELCVVRRTIVGLGRRAPRVCSRLSRVCS